MNAKPPSKIARQTILLTLALVGASHVRPVAADEFRIESKVFAGKDETPTTESLTLFDDGRVYDFLAAPREIIVFDISRGRIALLDPERKIKTELTTDKLTGFVDQLRARAARQTDSFLKFAAEPKFDESKEDHGWMKYSSPQMTYRVHAAKAESETMAHQYREFSDWSAKLNAMLQPGSLPPFPRLAINAALDRSGTQIPDEVQVTMGAQSRLGAKPTTLRSEHVLTPRLMAADRRRIDEAGQLLVTLPQTPLDQYLRPLEQAKR